ATSVMVVGLAIGRDEVTSLQAAAGNSTRCAIGLHATVTAPFRPLTMHFDPVEGGLFLPFPKLLRAGLLRRLDPGIVRARLSGTCSAARRISSTDINMRNCFRRCATPFSPR